ncbi:MAG: SGNH/GDSL hydrolase family protein [Terriglobia bacterium]|jgi:lysophospholipase L1-like esterase
MLPRRSWLWSASLKALLLFLGIAAAVVLLEAVLRFSNPFQTRIRGKRLVFPKSGTIRIKNKFVKRLDPVITVTINSLGFRGAEPPSDFSRHLTVITVGGSTTYCFMLSDQKTWPAQLENRLAESFQGVWVDNAGLVGNSTFAHIVLMEEFVSKLHPKVVLFLVGENDLVKGRFLSEVDSEYLKGRILFSSVTGFLRSVSAYSEVVALGVNLYRNYTAYRASLAGGTVDLTKVGCLKVPREVEDQYVASSSEPYIRSYETRLKRLIDISREAGIEPVFITQPLLVGPAVDDVTKVDLAAIKVDETRNGEMWWETLEAFNDVTRKVGHENNVLVIDLARQMPKSSRYFWDYMHYTNEGAQVVTDIVYRSLCPMLANKFPQYVKQGCTQIRDHAPQIMGKE